MKKKIFQPCSFPSFLSRRGLFEGGVLMVSNHGLRPRSLGILVFKMSHLAQEAVAQHPGNAGVAGVEALPDPALGVVGQVEGVVAPPGAVVVPEVVERIGGGGPDGEDRLLGCCRRLGCCCARVGCIRCAHVGVSVGWLKHQEPGQ